MNTNEPASEATKNTIENTVAWYLSDKLQDAATPIATKKFLTSDNTLVYLTQCNVAASSVPRVKVQVLRRVDGGVHETSYHLFSDHRLAKYENDMIFGNKPGGSDGSQAQEVNETDAAALVQLINSLTQARQTL